MQIYRKILITPKYLNEINIIIGLIILKPPSCFLSGMRDFSSVYSPTLHRKRQGSICHDEKVAYRPLLFKSYHNIYQNFSSVFFALSK